MGKAENKHVHKVQEEYSHETYPNQLILNAKCTRKGGTVAKINKIYKRGKCLESLFGWPIKKVIKNTL